MIGNIIPRIESVSAPDTIIRSSDATVSLYLISAQVFDADGIETIKWAGFTSFHIEGDSLMNNGNYIYLYDDGSDEILYEPNITSGDSIRGDGIFHLGYRSMALDLQTLLFKPKQEHSIGDFNTGPRKRI